MFKGMQKESIYRKSFNKSLSKVKQIFDTHTNALDSISRGSLVGDEKKSSNDNFGKQLNKVDNKAHPTENVQKFIKSKHVSKASNEEMGVISDFNNVGDISDTDEIKTTKTGGKWHGLKKDIRAFFDEEKFGGSSRHQLHDMIYVLSGVIDDFDNFNDFDNNENFDYNFKNESNLSTNIHTGSSQSGNQSTASTLSPEMVNFLESAAYGGNENPDNTLNAANSIKTLEKTAIIHSEYFKPDQYEPIFKQHGWKVTEIEAFITPDVPDVPDSSKTPTLIYEDGIYLYDKNTIKSNCLIKNQFAAECKAHLVNKEKLYMFVQGLRGEFAQGLSRELAPAMMKQYSGSQLSANSAKKLFAESPVWIVKPVGKGFYKGRGISVVADSQALKAAISAVKKLGAKSYIVAEYILDPLLYQGRKFHIRVHVIVGSDGKFIILDAMTRGILALEPYKKADFANKNIHDTHFTTRQNAIYDMGELLGAHCDAAMKAINAAIRACFSDFSPEPYPESKYAFETFGFDFMVTAAGDVKLIEINDKSGIAFDPEPFFAGVIETCDRLLLGEAIASQNIQGGCDLLKIPTNLNVYAKMSPDNPESREVMIALESLNKLPAFAEHTLSFNRVDSWDEADFVFRGKSSGFNDDLFRRLSKAEFGLINHFTSVDMLSNKANLAEYLHEHKITEIAPLTFVWTQQNNNSIEHTNVAKELQKHKPDSKWIVKPVEDAKGVLSWGGHGIQLLTLDQIKNTIEWQNGMKKAVIQEYIVDPLLYKDHKFDLRVYVLVLPKAKLLKRELRSLPRGHSGLQGYLFWGGYARVTLAEYDPKSTDPNVILTNYCVQEPLLKNSTDIKSTNVKSTDDIAKDIFEMDFDHDKVLTDIGASVTALFKPANLNPLGHSASFQIFGIDVILTAEQRPLILEVNSTPALYYLAESRAHKTNIQPALNRAIEYAFKARVGCEIESPVRQRYEYTRIF